MSDSRPIDEARKSAPVGERGYWRALEELGASGLLDEAAREFPVGAAEPPDGLSRRAFLKLMGASLALAGGAACAPVPEEILPYVDRPPEMTPGIARYYATSMEIGGYATGLLIESHEGRPTKVEGNPMHPASLGAAGVFEQASVLGLYDPQRMRATSFKDRPATPGDFTTAIRASASRDGGAGLRLLLEPAGSPLVADLLTRIRTRYPAARAYFYAPLEEVHATGATRRLFGRVLLPQYDFQRAEVVLALDADFLVSMPFHLRHARDFAGRRAIHGPDGTMNRLYAVESAPTVTGGAADHRLRMRRSDVQLMAAAILGTVLHAEGQPPVPDADDAMLTDLAAGTPRLDWARAVARDLIGHAGRCVVVPGDAQPPAVHVMAHLMNASLGNVGRTISFTEPVLVEAGEPSHEVGGLVTEIDAGAVDTLVILGGNPAYTAPADVELARAIRRVPLSGYVGLYENETARVCDWRVPGTHYLESWGDARAHDGTASFVQPLIAPLYGGMMKTDVLGALADDAGSTSYERLRRHWLERLPGGDPERAWREALQVGLVTDTAAPAVDATPDRGALTAALVDVEESLDGHRGIELSFAPDPSVRDGEFANNPWLQELPDPLTKLVWDNAALVSPATARSLRVETGDVLRLARAGRELHAPAFILPGHADDSITLHLGYGREGGEEVARGVGVNAFALRTSDAPFVARDVEVSRAGGHHALASTQSHWSVEGRPVVRGATLDEYGRDPDFTRSSRGRRLSLYKPHDYSQGNQWAMAIDLSLCTGCGACVMACQAENNVPVVGKRDVLKSREMHWLRIDRYFSGSPDDPTMLMQPMLCQHCENAPCEYVCPVNATVHGPEGLNQMVYNRCVGTRFCSNNCPYKVRRFNWFDYTARLIEPRELAMNPDVTVRARGVMEKCSFCVQRIREKEIAAGIEGRPLEAGEVTTACQQTCPTRAIAFGSLNDPDAELGARLADPRRYSALDELGTAPRVRYLARISNPNPELANDERTGAAGEQASHG